MFLKIAIVPTDQFQKVIQTNLQSVLLSFKYAAGAMLQGGSAQGGRLIAASSAAGKKGEDYNVRYVSSSNISCEGAPLHTAYCASKFGIRGIVQSAG
jgi:NAD(P)-dependent dehydrogenase (short-subunit alcohol dehydrogenase family)